MSATLTEPRVKNVVDALHADANRVDPPLLAAAEGKEGRERAALLDRAFIPVDEAAGRFLYALVRGAAPGTVVEFGTSFGISTLYMAAALRDRGAGSIVTTELHAGKARPRAATSNGQACSTSSTFAWATPLRRSKA